MDSSLGALFDLYVFPTGRRLFAQGQIGARAKARDFHDLAKHCATAITSDRACLALEQRWSGLMADSKGRSAAPSPEGAPPDAASIDPLVDKTLTAIRDHAENQTAGAAPDDAIHATVATFLKTIFPAGVQQVTRLPFVQELAAVDHILGLLHGKELALVVKDLGLGRLVKRLADLAVQYRAALEASADDGLVFGDVRAARSEGQDRLLETVALVLGRFHGRSTEDVAARDELLGPILEQNAAIGTAMRTRRTVGDVNPDTGAPEPGAQPGGTPSAAGSSGTQNG